MGGRQAFGSCKHSAEVFRILDQEGVLYKCGAMPFDERKDWLRLTITPNMLNQTYTEKILTL